jgi:hypothetical protein
MIRLDLINVSIVNVNKDSMHGGVIEVLRAHNIQRAVRSYACIA